MKKVLILGAGVYQVPLIKKCKHMGLYTIVSSIHGNYPGFQYADKVFFENTVDKEAILALAEKEQIGMIMTTGTDVAVSTIGYVCDRLGLCGISEESAQWVTNKAEMKERFRTENVRTAEFFRVSTLEEAYEVCRGMEMPVIFKCVDMSGSRGIMKVDSEEKIQEAFQYAMSYTHCDYIIIEQFLDGYEIGVDGYAGEGTSFIVSHDKLLYSNGATNVPIGHIFPYSCSDELQADIETQIKKALKALNLHRVFFNADVMICDGQCYIIEIGARCGATCIPELISSHFGIDYYEMMVKNAMGEPVSFPTEPICVSMGELLRSDKTGRITGIQLGKTPRNVDEIVLDFGVGDSVRKFMVGSDRIGHVIVHGDDMESAKLTLEEAKNSVRITVDEDL